MRPELIRASELLRANSPEAVGQAIDLLQNTVYSFSMKICGHREDAEDTMQDVLFRSLGHLTRFPDPGALAAWLYTVTRNRCRRIRRPRAHAPAKTLSLDELMPDEADLRILLQNGSESPEHQFMTAERHNLLHQAVLRLPPALRIVLVLHDMEELTTEQVAKILGLQAGTVAVRLHRGRLTLRREMQGILKEQSAVAWAEPTVASIATQKTKRRKKPLHCRELFARLSEYLDGRVGPTTCKQIEAHMENCPSCVAFLNDLRASIERCKTLNISCDPAVTSRLRALFTQEYLRMLGRPVPINAAAGP